MAEELFHNFYRLDIPLPHNPLKNLNSYFLRGQNGARSLLIDTGFCQDACRSAMSEQLASIGADLDHTDIFLTHLHSDHAGLAPELIRPGGHIYISEIDLRYLRAFEQSATWDAIDALYAAEGFPPDELEALHGRNPAKDFAPPPCDSYTCVHDGDLLDYGGRKLRCIATGGHTPGHLCLWDDETHTMFLGDHILFSITPNITAWPGYFNALGQYLKSLDKISTYDIRTALPAHRAVICPAKERIAQLKEHHARRLAEVLSIVTEQPGITAYETAGHMTWSIRCTSWAEFPLTQRWFAVGESMAHLEYLMAAGNIERYQDGRVYRYRLSGTK